MTEEFKVQGSKIQDSKFKTFKVWDLRHGYLIFEF
jgi:hypothetical protein